LQAYGTGLWGYLTAARTSGSSKGSHLNWNLLGAGNAFSHRAFLVHHIANITSQIHHGKVGMKRNELSGQLSPPVKLAFLQAVSEAVLEQKMGLSPATRYFRERQAPAWGGAAAERISCRSDCQGASA